MVNLLKILFYGLTSFELYDFFQSYFDKKFYKFKGCREPGSDIIKKELNIDKIQVNLRIMGIFGNKLSYKYALNQSIKSSQNYDLIIVFIKLNSPNSLDYSELALKYYKDIGFFALNSENKPRFVIILDNPYGISKIDKALDELGNKTNIMEIISKYNLKFEIIQWSSMYRVSEVLDRIFLEYLKSD